MEIRAAEGDEDFRGAIHAYNRAWQVGFRGMVPDEKIEASLRDTDDDAVAAFQDEVTGVGALVLVAEHEDDVVGYLAGTFASVDDFVAATDAEIVELYVDPAHWREGIASEMLSRFVDWLPDDTEGVVVKILGENDRAQAFFESQDFVFQDTSVLELDGDLHGAGIYRRPLEE